MQPIGHANFCGKKVAVLNCAALDVGENSVADQVMGSGKMEVLDSVGAVTSNFSSHPPLVPGSHLLSPSVGAPKAPYTLEVTTLAVVLEVTLGSSVSYESKRRAASSAGDSLERAFKLKASCNLDNNFVEGTFQRSTLA
ncbi:hypothetical protein GUJ93_ZPchr0007g4042 [Zizania palustris]|uniref:Uncharacterized protein n=1 Tax=Zizania palustris TaxID=103762 RepID=A0A8J5VQY4_ZIZPA|nr:hypothetical protein GUJ93_ZPchr0007g4042 [Zizania palustris]